MKITRKKFYSTTESVEGLQKEEKVSSAEKVFLEDRNQFEVDPDQKRESPTPPSEEEGEVSADSVAGDPVKFSQVDRAALLGSESLSPAMETALLGVAQLFADSSGEESSPEDREEK